MGLFDFFKREEPVAKADRLVIDDEDDEVVDDSELEDEVLPDKEAPADRETAGPFDDGEEAGDGPFVDLGSLRVPARQGLALRLEMEDATKRVIAVALDLAGSTLQVQAFAAPRGSGLWADVRGQLAEQIAKQQGTAEERENALGTALSTAVPIVAGGAPERKVEFIGVDGPRWFLRGVITGAATIDDGKYDELVDLFRGIVVVRGGKPVPPRDLLPLEMPKAMAEQLAAAREAQARAAAEKAARVQREQQAKQEGGASA